MQDVRSLPAEVTIYTIAELHPQCLAWMAADMGSGTGTDSDANACADTLRVDAQAVMEVDAAGVQLLLSLSNALAREQRQLQILMPSAPLVAACQTLGAGRLLAEAAVPGEAQ